MVTFTKAELVLEFPEFSSVDDTRINAVRETARKYVSEGVFGDRAEHALMLYTAHLLTVTGSDRAGGKGTVTGERVGDLSRNYGSVSQVESDLNSTSYGQQFKTLARIVNGGGFVSFYAT